jgi:Eukaryotic aspartyl protease
MAAAAGTLRAPRVATMATLALLLVLVLVASLGGTVVAAVHSFPLARRPARARRAFDLPARAWAPASGVTNADDGVVFVAAAAPPQRARGALPEQEMLGDLVTLGEYFLALDVGGQTVNVQIDTGSSTLAVPLRSCTNCLPHDHRLDLDKTPTPSSYVKCGSSVCRANSCHMYDQCSACSRRSKACCSTIDPDKCGFFLTYADGSGASGALVQADVTMANITVPVVFGAILSVSQGFENNIVDGILGMAFKGLACNPTCVVPIFDVLVKEGKVERDVFAICTGRNGGVLTLGGSNPALYDGALKYVPLIRRRESHFYDVGIHAVRIDESNVRIPDFSDGIVDSGTTVLVIAPRAYAAFREYFQMHFCHVPGLCPEGRSHLSAKTRRVQIIRASPERAASMWQLHEVSLAKEAGVGSVSGVVREEPVTWFSPGYCGALTDAEVGQLPKITIVLSGGVELTLEPEMYMLKYEVESRLSWNPQVFRCLGMTYLPGLDRMENNVILGDVVMQKYYVEFDREKMRIGFAESRNCVHPYQEAWWTNDATDSGTGSGASGKHALSAGTLSGIFIASCLAWVYVLYLWTREAKRVNGYEPIS